MKKIISSLFTAVTAVLMCSVIEACSDKADNGVLPSSPEEPSPAIEKEILEPVAMPDFVFSSAGNVFLSTLNSTTTRVEPENASVEEFNYAEYYNRQEPGEVEVNLTVADELPDMDIRGWEKGMYQASKLTIHVRTATEVSVFLPIEAQYYSKNDANSLAIIETHDRQPGISVDDPEAAKWKVVGVYGETSQSYIVNGNEFTANIYFGKTQEGTEGIELEVKGVNASVLNALYGKWSDGLTIEVWIYYKNTLTRENMRTKFNDGATISFSSKPAFYVNAFAKVRTGGTDWPNEYDGKVYGETTPFIDEEKTQILDNKYWIGVADGILNKEATNMSYLLNGHKDEWNCNVKYVGVEYSKKYTRNASNPNVDELTSYPVLVGGLEIDNYYLKSDLNLPDNSYNEYYFD